MPKVALPDELAATGKEWRLTKGDGTRFAVYEHQPKRGVWVIVAYYDGEIREVRSEWIFPRFSERTFSTVAAAIAHWYD